MLYIKDGDCYWLNYSLDFILLSVSFWGVFLEPELTKHEQEGRELLQLKSKLNNIQPGAQTSGLLQLPTYDLSDKST